MKNNLQWFQFVRHNPDGGGTGVVAPPAAPAAPVTLPAVGVMAAPPPPAPRMRTAQEMINAAKAAVGVPIVPETQPLAEEIVREAPPVAQNALPNIQVPATPAAQPVAPVAPTGGADAGLEAFDSAAIESIFAQSPNIFANTGPVSATPAAPEGTVAAPVAPQMDIAAIIREEIQKLIPQVAPQAPAAVQAPSTPAQPTAPTTPTGDVVSQVQELTKQKFREAISRVPGMRLGDVHNHSLEDVFNAALAGQPKLYAVPQGATDAQKAAINAMNDQATRTIYQLRQDAQNAAMMEVMAKGLQPAAPASPAPVKTPPSANQMPIEQAIVKDTYTALDTIAAKGGVNAAFSNPLIRDAVVTQVFATWDTYPPNVPPSKIVADAVKKVYDTNKPVFAALAGNVQPVTQKTVESQAAPAPTINTVPRTTAPGSAAPSMQQGVLNEKNPHQPGTALYHQWAAQNAMKRLSAPRV